MQYNPQSKILCQVQDCFGDLWDVTESRPTEFDWEVLLGYPIIGKRSMSQGGNSAIILTEPLRNYLEENRMSSERIRLPISGGGVSRARRRLGMNYYRDKEQWWQQVKQELLHPEEPPIPALLDTDRLTPHNIWPKAVLRRFVELVKEGKSHYEIAAILGQRFSSVRFHARVLFPRQGRHHQNWTNEEKHNVIKLTQAKRSVEEIMKVMDRSRYSVIIMQREIAGTRSRKCSLRTGREYLDWTDEEHQKLEKLALDGISPSEIAILMGRTRVAVKTRCRKLGLKYCWKRACYYLPDSASSPELRDIIGKSSEKLSPKAERRWRPWTEEEDQKIRGLALDGIFAAVIAEITGRTPAAIRKRCQNVLGLKYDRNRARYFPPDAASSPD